MTAERKPKRGAHRPRRKFPLSKKNDFAVYDFVKIFRSNPAVIDSCYRNEARHSALRLAKSDKKLYFLSSWALFLR